MTIAMKVAVMRGSMSHECTVKKTKGEDGQVLPKESQGLSVTGLEGRGLPCKTGVPTLLLSFMSTQFRDGAD